MNSSIFYLPGGGILNVHDGSNATYIVGADGSVTFSGYTNQGGVDQENVVTLYNFLSGGYAGLTGNVSGDVSIKDTRIHKGANRGGDKSIDETYSKHADATALTMDFYGMTFESAIKFSKNAGKVISKFKVGAGALGVAGSITSIGIHYYNNKLTWKDGVTSAFVLANVALLAIPVVGEVAVLTEIFVLVGTTAWDTYTIFSEE